MFNNVYRKIFKEVKKYPIIVIARHIGADPDALGSQFALRDLIKNKFPSNVFVEPYIEDMTRMLKNTDLIVTRAGASTMSEIMALSIPTIFIPSPYVTNNHQYKNAKDLCDRNASWLIEEKDLSKTTLIKMIDDALTNEEKYNEVKENLSTLGIKDSGTRIYNVLKEMILNDKKFY